MLVGDEGGVRQLLRRSEFVDRSGRLLRLHDEASVEALAVSTPPPTHPATNATQSVCSLGLVVFLRRHTPRLRRSYRSRRVCFMLI